VVGQDRLSDLTALGEGQPIGVQQEAEPPERLALPGVGDVAFIAQRDQCRAAAARSQMTLPGPAQSKSMRAVATPSRNIRLAG
jgi:hypothetical protein